MQKKLIAVAVLGLLSAGAYAAENVTLYGVADVYVGSLKVGDDGKRHTVINNGGLSGSRIGFTGAEDLGSGVKAIFKMEYGVNIDAGNGVSGATYDSSKTGTGFGAARQTYAGLTGGFGTVIAGRLQTTGYDWGCAYDALGGSALSTMLYTKTGSNLLSCGSGGRVDNAIAYVSPSFGGVTVALNHTRLTETTTANSQQKDGNASLLSVTYANGPLSAGLVFDQGKRYNTNNTESAKWNEWGLGASYDFTAVKLFAAWQQYKDKMTNGDKHREANLGVSVPVGAGSIIATYTNAKVKPTSGDSKKTNGYALAYAHSLSKRTTAYTGYSYIKNKAYGANGDVGNTWGVADTTVGAGEKSNAFVVGMRHTF